MPNQEFLETYPLYRKFMVKRFPKYISELPKPAIKMYCGNCKSEQTFNMINEYYECKSPTIIEKWNVVRAKYDCMRCNNFKRYFFIKIGSDFIKKVGQLPPWDISVEKEIRVLLGNRLQIYQNGLICESQGYGIGAFAYYRRIVEDIIDELLDDMYVMIDEKNKVEYKAALDQIKTSHNAEDKIKAVQDLLPLSLRPDGNNPLKLLYSTLSEGLHSDSDDDCLENAEILRHILTFLITEVKKHQRDSERFTNSIKKLVKNKEKK